MAKKSAKSKGYRKQNVKKPYLSKKDIAIVCVIAALLAVGAFFLFRYDDGALKVQDGKVVTEGDNWLIVDGSNVRGRSRYFKIGEIGEIAEYSREKSSLNADANVPEYVFRPAQEGGGDITITVTSGHGSAQALAEHTLASLEGFEATTVGTLETTEMAGRPVCYYTYAADYTAKAGDAETAEADAADGAEAPESEAAESTEEATEAAETDAEAAEDENTGAGIRYARSVAGYIDAPSDNCVIIHVESRGDTDDDCLPDEALLALLEQGIAAVTLDEAQ